MINHRTIRSRVISYIIASTISLIMLIGAVLLIRNSITREKDYWAGSIPIDEAIEQGYNDPDTYRLDDHPVYVEIKEAPVRIDYEEKHEKRKKNGSYNVTVYYFYFVNYNGNTYMMRTEDNDYSELMRRFEENGKATLSGVMGEPTQRLIDTAYKEFSKTPEGAGLSKEEFLEMTGGVVFRYGSGGPDGAAFAGIIGIILIFFGLYFLKTCPWLIRYAIAQLRLTPGEKEIIAAELDDPRTAHIQSCSVYLTPGYLVYLGKELVIVPYQDILWVYPVLTGIIRKEKRLALLVRDFSNKKIVRLSAKNRGADQLLGQLMAQIQAHNPQIAFGNTPQLRQYFDRLRRRG